MTLGEPVEAELSVRTSFNWNLIGDFLSEAECYYDIILEQDVWLISGCKRAHFQVKARFLSISLFLLAGREFANVPHDVCSLEERCITDPEG